MLLNRTKSTNFNHILNVYLNDIDPDQTFDSINSSVISNMKYICEAFFFLIDYLEEDKAENNILQSQKEQTLTVKKQVRDSVEQLIGDLAKEQRKKIQQLLPTITNNVKNQLIKHKPLSTSQLRKNKLFRIQSQVALALNDLNFNFQPFCFFKLIEIVVIIYKYVADIENYIDDNPLFLNHNQNVNVSSSMKEKFNKIALNQHQKSSKSQSPQVKRQQLVDNISRFVVTNLKENNFKMI